ncbi:MAG: bifunctional acetate--CoA ligase family protein/GNAT family N-acetyltransferase [Saprospiraceae bacterium]|nr:bifunctional acetate--CoA ligase family protein/GNAT family N-acetyltransferase [Saprospiraceae bacterium]
MDNRLNHIFHPKTIAVIGASNRVNTIGYALMHNLVGSNYKGMVFPVNLKETSIQGVKCYHRVGDIPESLDLAIIATPAASVPDVIQECGEAKVGGVLIISSGFKEVGEQGQRLSDITMEIARKYNLRLLGPNCLGFINPSIGLNASFAGRMAKKGKIAFISQSGALCTSILERAKTQKMGFSHFVSIGDMLDIGFHDLIDYFGRSANTSSILIYMESLADARKFMSAARAFARDKPIIVLKAGRSREGARATLSHTGSLAGNDAVFDAALKRAGVIRVETIAQLFNCAQSLAIQKRPHGNRLAIITNAGGPGILATDHLIHHGGKLAEFSQETIDALNKVLPETWSHSNPVDLAGDAWPHLYRKALEICLKDENTDGILVILTPQALVQPKDVEKELIEVTERPGKTILAAWMGEGAGWSGKTLMRKGNVPVYHFPEDAVDVFLKMYQYTRNIELLQETPSNIPEEFTPNTAAAHQLLNSAIEAGRSQLSELEAKEILSFYDMPVSQSQLAFTEEEAVEIADSVGFPVVLKVVSYDIGLKTDIGGVRLNIKTPDEVRLAYDQIIHSIRRLKPEASILGISVEKMVFKRYELLIGANKDPIFGSVIVFGMGGIAVEVFKDRAIELPPLNMALAKRIIEGTKIFHLLKGYRGIPQSDIRAVQFLLYKFAYLIIDCPQILEIDINPYVIDERGGIILDAYIILDNEYKRKPLRPYRHMVISPYPKQYETTIRMKNAQQVFLRPIRPEDEPLEEELLSSLSKETQYFRFFGFMPSIPKKLLKRSSQIDYDREMAIIAIIEENGKKKMIAEVRLLATHDNSEAEFAIVISDDWQGMGLGNKMTTYILDIAKKRNIKTINATVLKVNKAMIHIFKSLGFTFKSIDFSTYSARLELSKLDG